MPNRQKSVGTQTGQIISNGPNNQATTSRHVLPQQLVGQGQKSVQVVQDVQIEAQIDQRSAGGSRPQDIAEPKTVDEQINDTSDSDTIETTEESDYSNSSSDESTEYEKEDLTYFENEKDMV